LLFIGKAGLVVSIFGIPWWFMTQLRDDTEFRHTLEDFEPKILSRLRSVFPQFIPHDQAACYRECKRSGSSLSTKGVFAPSTLPSLGLRTSLGSLETEKSLREEILVHLREDHAAAGKAAEAASALVARGDATRLYREAKLAEFEKRKSEVEHAVVISRSWSQSYPQCTWLGDVDGSGRSGGWWGGMLGTGKRSCSHEVHESSLVPGCDDECTGYWGSRQALRLFLEKGPVLSIKRDQLAVVKGGSLFEAAKRALEESKKNAPMEPPLAMPWDSWGASLKSYFETLPDSKHEKPSEIANK